MSEKIPSRINLVLLLIGFPLSFIWEYLQMPLFHVEFINPFINSHIILSILSTILDLIGIYAIYFIMASLFGKSWIAQWSVLKVLVVMISGMAVVVAGERLALTFGLWRYAVVMPVIPILDIGITPFLIFALVPIATMYIASKLA